MSNSPSRHQVHNSGQRARSRSCRRSISGRRHRSRRCEEDTFRSDHKPMQRSPSRPKEGPSSADAVDAAAAEPRRKRRSSKWDEPASDTAFDRAGGSTTSAGASEPAPMMLAGPPSGKNYKVIKMTGVQIRALLGPKGESINRLRRQSGCDIQVHHRYPDPEGNVSIVGSVAIGEKMVAGLLAERGCPLMPSLDSLLPEEIEEIPIAQHLVGLFIGQGGQRVREMQDLCGGGVHISIQPPLEPGGGQFIKIVGPNRVKARAMIQMKVDAIKYGHSVEKPPK